MGPDERIFTSGERGIGIYVLIRGTFNFHANQNLLEGLPGQGDIDMLLVGPEQPPDGYEVRAETWLRIQIERLPGRAADLCSLCRPGFSRMILKQSIECSH